MSRRLGWGLIGCGWVGRDLVAPAIASCPDAELVAVCDRDPNRRSAVAASFPGVSRWSDVAGLLSDDAVEAVYVATPNDTHAAIVLAAAAARRHVLCEKPMATTPPDAVAMLAACDDAGVRYATAFDQRYHAAHQRLRELIVCGALGTVTLVRVHYACWLGDDWSPWPAGEATENWRIDQRQAGGGALIDLAPHSVDLLPYLLADVWSDLVALEQRRVHGYEVADGAVLAGRMAGGTLASISVSYNCPEGLPRRQLEVHGTAAMAVAVDTMGQTAGGELTVIDGVDGRRRRIELPPELDRDPFQLQIEAFGRHVLVGAALPVDGATDVAHVELLANATRPQEVARLPAGRASASHLQPAQDGDGARAQRAGAQPPRSEVMTCH